MEGNEIAPTSTVSANATRVTPNVTAVLVRHIDEIAPAAAIKNNDKIKPAAAVKEIPNSGHDEAFSKDMERRRKAEENLYRQQQGRQISKNFHHYKRRIDRYLFGSPLPAHVEAIQEKKLPSWQANPHLPRNRIPDRPKKCPPINCEPDHDSIVSTNLYYFARSPIRAILPKKWFLVIIDLRDSFFKAHPNLNRTYAYEHLDLEELICMAIGGNRHVECVMEMHRRFLVKFYGGKWDSRDPVPRNFREQNIRENYLYWYDQDWKIQRDVDIFHPSIGRGRGDGPTGVYRGPV